MKEKQFALKIVGRSRNEFGTRLCHRISCERCQKIDYISVKLSEQNQKLCRTCAEKFLNAYEQGRFIEEKTAQCLCSQCGRGFDISLKTASSKKDEIYCIDCYRGFDVWRGKTGEAVDRKKYILKPFGAKTVVRKFFNEST